jgi:hypothetical protein
MPPQCRRKIAGRRQEVHFNNMPGDFTAVYNAWNYGTVPDGSVCAAHS